MYTKVQCNVILRKLFYFNYGNNREVLKELFNVLDIKTVRLGVTVQICIFK